MKNIPVYIIAPLKGHEFKRMCNNIGGEFITLSAGSHDRVNIFEIRPVDTENYKLIHGEENDESILAEKIAKLLTFVKLLIPNISLEDERKMDDALIETYARKGITRDNSSLIATEWIEKNNLGEVKKLVKYKSMPVFTDLYAVLNENDKTKGLADLLKIFVDGSSSNFNGDTNVNLKNKMTIFDVSKLSKEFIPVGMFVAFEYIWDKIKEDITQKKVIIIDEAWLLMNSDAVAANFVLEAFKAIRGYGGASVVATQDINDFYSYENGKYGKAVLSNSQIKYILNLKEEEAETVAKIFKLTSEEQKQIMTLSKGSGLVFANRSSFLCDFKASPYEEKIITTDRKDLEKIAKDNKYAA